MPTSTPPWFFGEPEPLKEWQKVEQFTASALLSVECFRETNDSELVFATHDRVLGNAARAVGFSILGL
jgi:hypothetical protein